MTFLMEVEQLTEQPSELAKLGEKLNKDPELLDNAFRDRPSLAARILCQKADALAASGIATRLRLLFAGSPTLGSPEAHAELKVRTLLDILPSHSTPGEYAFRIPRAFLQTILASQPLKGKSVRSSVFYCHDRGFRLVYYPIGHPKAKDCYMSLYLEAASPCSANFQLFVNDIVDSRITYEFPCMGSARGTADLLHLSSFKELLRQRSDLTLGVTIYRVNGIDVSDHVDLISWAQTVSEVKPHVPLSELYAALPQEATERAIVKTALSNSISSPCRCLSALVDALTPPEVITPDAISSFAFACHESRGWGPKKVLKGACLQWAFANRSELVHTDDWVASEIGVAAEITKRVVLNQTGFGTFRKDDSFVDGVVKWARHCAAGAKHALQNITKLATTIEAKQEVERYFVSRLFGGYSVDAMWLSADQETVVAVARKLIKPENESVSILNGIVAWARQEQVSPEKVLARIFAVVDGIGRDHVGNGDATLKSVVGQFFDASGDEIQPFIERVMIGQDESTEAQKENSDTEPDNDDVSVKRRRKVVLDAAAAWARPRLKRLRVSSAWPDIQPVALSSVTGGPKRSEEAVAAAASWAAPADASQIIDAALLMTQDPVMRELLTTARKKAAQLERSNAASADDVGSNVGEKCGGEENANLPLSPLPSSFLFRLQSSE